MRQKKETPKTIDDLFNGRGNDSAPDGSQYIGLDCNRELKENIVMTLGLQSTKGTTRFLEILALAKKAKEAGL